MYFFGVWEEAYLERSHAGTGRTCKLHTDGLQLTWRFGQGMDTAELYQHKNNVEKKDQWVGSLKKGSKSFFFSLFHCLICLTSYPAQGHRELGICPSCHEGADRQPHTVLVHDQCCLSIQLELANKLVKAFINYQQQTMRNFFNMIIIVYKLVQFSSVNFYFKHIHSPILFHAVL